MRDRTEVVGFCQVCQAHVVTPLFARSAFERLAAA